MKLYRIKPESKEYSLIRKVHYCKSEWFFAEIKKAIENLIGTEIKQNLYLTEKRLILRRPPAGKKSQFEKVSRNGYYRANEGSLLNREYIKLCKTFGLRDYSITEFSLETGLLAKTGGIGGNVFHHIGNNFYVEVAREDIRVDIELPWLEKIKDSEYSYLLPKIAVR